jgi:hypothetical protein
LNECWLCGKVQMAAKFGRILNEFLPLFLLGLRIG